MVTKKYIKSAKRSSKWHKNTKSKEKTNQKISQNDSYKLIWDNLRKFFQNLQQTKITE